MNIQLFLNHFRHPVVIAQPTGEIIIANPAFEALFNREMSDSSNIFDVLHNNETISELLRKAVEIRGSYSLRSVNIERILQSPKSMDVEIFPLIDDQGNFTSVGLTLLERGGAHSFEEQEKRLSKISYLKMIASGLAHEIKNPLSGIKGASQLLSRELKQREDLKEYAEIIEKEVKRVDELIGELMHLTKPRTLNKSAVNINLILHELVLLQQTVSPEKISFVEDFDPSLPEIRADSKYVSQVFLNLIKNARQAIKKEGVITIRSRYVTDYALKTGEKKRQMIAIDIKDTGHGIDESTLDNIFTPFYTTKAEGTGLGLPLCHQIIGEHEGDIKIKSKVGEGTTFTVYLPI